jgi:hypothetical protein
VRFAGGLVLGLIVGGAAGAGGMYLHVTRAPAVTPSPAEPPPPAPPAKRKPRRAAAPSAGDEAPPVVSAADLRIAAEGDTLRAAPLALDLGAGAPEPRDLAQDEIDGTFARRAGAIIACITAARGQAPVNGRVVAGVVVGADGRVTRSRVEAPAYLLRRGLGGCARRELAALRFPATGRETVVTVPFDVEE